MLYLFIKLYMRNLQVRTINSEINHSLSLIERVVLYNMSLYNNVEDKINYLENFYGDLITEVFAHKKYIVETFKYRYSGKIIVETKKDVKEKIYEFHSFIKRAIKFDYLNEQQTPDSVSAKLGVKQNIKPSQPEIRPIGKTPVTKSNQPQLSQGSITPIKKLEELGFDGYFETLREALYSTPGTITQIALALTGPGKIAVNIPWGALTLYDFYNYSYKGKKSYLSKVIADIINIVINIVIPKLSEMREALKVFSKSTLTGFDAAIKLLAKTIGKKMFIKIVTILLKFSEVIFGPIESGLSWMEEQLNINLGSENVGEIKKFAQELNYACEENIKHMEDSEVDKNSEHDAKSVGIDRTMDPGKI